MSKHSKLGGNDLQFKPFLTTAKRSGSYMDGDKIVKGSIIEEELEIPNFDGEDALDTLLDGVDADDIDEGRGRLLAENPKLASLQVDDMMDEVADSMDKEAMAEELGSPKRVASTKRTGMITDNSSDETINFRRTQGGTMVELTDDDGGVIETLTSKEFDAVLDTGTFTVL